MGLSTNVLKYRAKEFSQRTLLKEHTGFRSEKIKNAHSAFV